MGRKMINFCLMIVLCFMFYLCQNYMESIRCWVNLFVYVEYFVDFFYVKLMKDIWYKGLEVYIFNVGDVFCLFEVVRSLISVFFLCIVNYFIMQLVI